MRRNLIAAIVMSVLIIPNVSVADKDDGENIDVKVYVPRNGWTTIHWTSYGSRPNKLEGFIVNRRVGIELCDSAQWKNGEFPRVMNYGDTFVEEMPISDCGDVIEVKTITAKYTYTSHFK